MAAQAWPPAAGADGRHAKAASGHSVCIGGIQWAVAHGMLGSGYRAGWLVLLGTKDKHELNTEPAVCPDWRILVRPYAGIFPSPRMIFTSAVMR